ncbi:MAG: metalloregulator ArsR/SmtB family transcription factor [Candidatus Hydrothermarchaeales archaeon]
MLGGDFQKAKCNLFQALSDETRLRILEELMEEEKLNVSEICERTGKDQSSISHHLACLRNCGLVKVEKEGKFMVYYLNGRDRVAKLLKLADDHVTEALESILRYEAAES